MKVIIRRKLQNAEFHRGVRTSLIRLLTTLRFDQAQELARIVCEAGEYCVQIAVAEVLGDDFAEHAAIVGGHGQVAAFD